jgi:protein farnesyltransferase/geranylgeranyltransferase type-1 subunit alpha
VWKYRQWLVGRFDLWHDKEELAFAEQLLDEDVRNNSAWNHRWHVTFGDEKSLGNRETVQSEIAFAQQKIRLSPQNESPWSYLRGLSIQAKGPAAFSLADVEEFAGEFADADDDHVRSSYALDVLAEIYEAGAERHKKVEASKALDLLSNKYDPIRKGYWQYRKAMLNLGENTGVTA